MFSTCLPWLVNTGACSMRRCIVSTTPVSTACWLKRLPMQEWPAINDRMRRAAQGTVKESYILKGEHP